MSPVTTNSRASSAPSRPTLRPLSRLKGTSILPRLARSGSLSYTQSCPKNRGRSAGDEISLSLLISVEKKAKEK
ncbi:hypothetical protein FCM35_KLT10636 [Carex littledalei]|uniref:Uncharacterized protein n=1 Tax=Carex littledalei TaxID=544730 RepID=A0A833VHR0_9POAL|nr:hypothetical protein FCM35_KLT10636 [Carex littledalei]